MRSIFCLLFVVLLLGCRKGKTMPHDVYVHYDGVITAHQYPVGAFYPVDPNDIYEIPQYPSYVDQDKNDDLANDFNNYLKDLLKKNNIILTSDPAEYSLHVTSISVVETRGSESYTDSCSWTYQTNYVYYAKLSANVKIILRKNGLYVTEWNRKANSSEKVRDRTDACNRPEIRSTSRGPSSLISQLAKELRVKISKKLYELEVN